MRGKTEIPIRANEPVVLASGTVVGLLGRGGMAHVYKIWNEKLEVFRAVKILIPNQREGIKNRFETEAKITAKLHHPNIVEVHSIGDWQGLPYIEMEFIDGYSLDNIISHSGKLPPQVCSAVSVFIIRALTYAHSQEFLLYGRTYQGVIHRDLKPANIMISVSGDLKLMDFGIARPMEASLHTVDGNIVGTLQYLSPEQIDGANIDSRADIYSFGAILYELLTGRKTFPQGDIPSLLKQKIVNEYRKLDKFDFPVPSGLAKICHKCLQLEKDNRFTNSSRLLEELEAEHYSLTSEPPEAVLKSFIKDPASIQNTSPIKIPLPVKPKVLIFIAAGVLISGVIAVTLLFGPTIVPPKKSAHVKAATLSVEKSVPQPNSSPKPPDTLASGNAGQPPLTVSGAKNPLTENRFPKISTPAKTPQAFDHRKKPPALIKKITPTVVEVNAVPIAPPPVKEDTSPVAKIETLYKSSDYFIIGKFAMQKSDYNAAILALTMVPADHPRHEEAVLYLISAYIESGRIQAAVSLIKSNTINDAEFYFLSGRASMKQGYNKEAVDLFQAALTKPSSIRSITDVRMDALYYTAIAYRALYSGDPSPDKRKFAIQAWSVVKNAYSGNPNHPRFIKAVEETANIK
jgi:serine/threonine protein kinase